MLCNIMPEVLHTEHGKEMLHNFLYEVCGFTGTWTMANYAKLRLKYIRNTVGDGKVFIIGIVWRCR